MALFRLPAGAAQVEFASPSIGAPTPDAGAARPGHRAPRPSDSSDRAPADTPTFCAEPTCVLHVRPGDPGVIGWGNWARLDNGMQFGRQRRGDAFYCDACARRHA